MPVSRNTGEYLPLERLWAYLTIKQLLDERDAADEPADKEQEDTPEKKALSIALRVTFLYYRDEVKMMMQLVTFVLNPYFCWQYEFVTPLTSLVVVKPNATKAVDAESVDKQSKIFMSI